ncbi:uncharacterized protein JCM10292_000953 [Rhodotorula paludigena]|uniref:uncharacterized protein n=1 Tax=Rhodotorula paludigena TaxID=86838 RepID=UPI00317E40BB
MADAVTATGALLIAVVIAAWLSSATTHLASSYIRRTLDPWQWRAGVVALVALDSAHTGIFARDLYDRLILNFGDEGRLSDPGWTLTAHLAILLLLASITQTFFALKLATLYIGKTRASLTGVISLLCAAQLAFGIAAAYHGFTSTISLFVANLDDQASWQFLASSLAMFLCNTVISVAVVADMRGGKFAAKEETVVQVASRLVLETNMLTALVSILSFAFFLAWNVQDEESGVSLGLSMLLPKLYLLSLLASLSRDADVVRAGLARAEKHGSSLSDFFKGVPLSRMRPSGAIATSRIGTPVLGPTPTPIADRYAQGGAIKQEEEPSWMKKAFQPPLSSQQNPPLPNPHSLAPPLARPDRPMTAALSVSDYGEWLDDACAAPPAALPSAGGRTEGESIHFGAPPGVAATARRSRSSKGRSPVLR